MFMSWHIEITGKRFGKLVALKKVGYSVGKSPKQLWECRCDCGNVVVVRKSALFRGHTRSCGCLSGEKAKNNFLKLKKSGMLTPVRYSRPSFGIFRCDCGVEKEMRIDGFKGGHSKSCGCYGRKVSLEARIKAKTTHGMSNTRFYRIFQGMKYRCESRNCPHYAGYGERGIRVEWDTFESFRDDMYKSYLTHCEKNGGKNTTINRIDNDGNYCKLNCEWSTVKFQARNRRTSRRLSFRGEIKTLAEWSEITGISRNVIESRLDRYGWTTEKALTKEVRHN